MNKEHVELLESRLRQSLPEALEILRQMVSINSFTDNAAGVNSVGELTAKVFAPLGFSSESIPSNTSGHGNHLVLRRLGETRKTIGLVTHLDTVFPPEEEAKNNFRWLVEKDRIYGPGTHDIKGGTVMIFLILSAMHALFPKEFNSVNWVILADSHEEQLAVDFGDLCLKILGKEVMACLVFEGGAMQGTTYPVVVARKGRIEFRVRVEGRAAHASLADQGVNAIVQLSRVLPVIANLADHAKDLSVNLGAIRSPTVINRVPHWAEADGEMRAFELEVLDEVKQKLLALSNLEESGIIRDRSSLDGFHARVHLDILHESPPWPRNPATDRIYKAWSETALGLGWKTLAEHRGGLSDGNYTMRFLPTLDGLGPDGGNDHCSERAVDGSKLPEYVDVSSFVPKAILNIMAIIRLIHA